MIYPMQSVFVTSIDWGIRFPVTLFNSYGRFYYMNRPNELIRSIDKKFNNELDRLLSEIGTLNKKKQGAMRERLNLLGTEKDNYLRPIYDRLSDDIIQLCPPMTILAMEDQSYFYTLDSYDGRVLGYLNRSSKDLRITEEWCHKIRLKILLRMLQEKSITKGIEIMMIDPYNTSCMCPRCGRINHDNRDKYRHIYRCDKCGLICNDDGLAAWNIHNAAYQKVFKRNYTSTINGYKPVILKDSEPRSLL